MDSEELIGKMDALLNKHRQSPPPQTGHVPEIPVLVNVVEVPSSASAKPIQSPVAPKELTPVASAATAVPAPLSDSDAQYLARGILRHVMKNLEARLARELGDQLAERLESVF